METEMETETNQRIVESTGQISSSNLNSNSNSNANVIPKLTIKLSRVEKIKYGRVPIKTKSLSQEELITMKDLLASIPFSFTKPFIKYTIENIRNTLQAIYRERNPESAILRRNGSKSKLLDILLKEMNYQEEEKKFLKKIIKIQKMSRLFLNNEIRRLIGPGIPVNLCLNDECPYTMEPLEDIPENQLITWKEDNKKYGCDIVALLTDLKSKLSNPTFLKNILQTKNGSVYSDLVPSDIRNRQRILDRYNLKNPFTRKLFSLEFFFRIYQYSCKILKKPIVNITPARTRTEGSIPLENEYRQRVRESQERLFGRRTQLHQSLRDLGLLPDAPVPVLTSIMQDRFHSAGIDIAVRESDVRNFRRAYPREGFGFVPRHLVFTPSEQESDTEEVPRSSSDVVPEPQSEIHAERETSSGSGLRLRLTYGTHSQSSRSYRGIEPISFTRPPNVEVLYMSSREIIVPPEIMTDLGGLKRHPFFPFYDLIMKPEHRSLFLNLDEQYRRSCEKSIEIVSQFRDLGYYMEPTSLSLPMEALTIPDLTTSQRRNRHYGRWYHQFFENWTIYLRSSHRGNYRELYENNDEIISFINHRINDGGLHSQISSAFQAIYRGEWHRSIETPEIEYRPLFKMIKFIYIIFIELYDKLLSELSPETHNTIAMNLIIPMVRAGLLPADSFSWAVGI
jgi:hypothetical protein